MCCPNGLVIHPFGLKTGIDPAHFGVESGMVFKGTTGVKNLLFQLQISKTGREICQFGINLWQFVWLVF